MGRDVHIQKKKGVKILSYNKLGLLLFVAGGDRVYTVRLKTPW